MLGELTAVLLADGATVDDAGVLRSLGRDGIGQPLADGSVNLLSLLSGSDLAGSNGPVINVLASSPANRVHTGGVVSSGGGNVRGGQSKTYQTGS